MSAPSHLAVVDPAAVGVVAGLDPTGGAGLLRDHLVWTAPLEAETKL